MCVCVVEFGLRRSGARVNGAPTWGAGSGVDINQLDSGCLCASAVVATYVLICSLGERKLNFESIIKKSCFPIRMIRIQLDYGFPSAVVAACTNIVRNDFLRNFSSRLFVLF